MKRAALCIVLAVAVGGCGGGRHTGRQLPARFVAVSLSALDDRDFVLLGTVPCSVGRCYVIERTADGGRPGSFGYDPRDDAEVVRIARLIAEEPELAFVDHDDLRTALASVRNGSTFTF